MPSDNRKAHDRAFVAAYKDNWRQLELLRKKRAVLILTPAPDRGAVLRKRREATDVCIPISSDQIDAAIAADEAFLDAHPISRRWARRKTKAADV